MPVTRDGVLHRDVENFIFGAGDLEAAVFFAWIIPAVYEFSIGLWS